MRPQISLGRALGVVLAGLAAVLSVAPVPAAAGVAQAGASASVSDTRPDPGQTVTVRAAGLAPGTTSFVDYIPDGVRLATVTVDGSGAYSVSVRIPPTTYDGAKQIVVTAIAADGNYAYLPTNLTIRGPDASARLSDTRLTPREAFRVTGARFLAGSEVAIALFPEQAVLGSPTAGPDGSFAADVRMPKDLLNGKHVIVVAGATTAGGYAYLQLTATVTGGIGNVPTGYAGPGEVFEMPERSSTTTSTTHARRITTTLPEVTRSDRAPAGSGNGVVLVAVGAAALAVGAALAASWMRTPEGRQWRSRRRQERARRKAR